MGAPASWPAGARQGCSLLSPWKLWVRAWLHVPGKKESELASEQEAPPGFEEGSSASEGVTQGPTFPLADLSSNCILPASPLDSSSRLSLEARAKLRPTTFPVPEKSWREPPSLWHGASSRLRWQRMGRARAWGLSCMARGLPDTRWADLAALLALVVCEVPEAAACKTTFPGCPRGQHVRPPRNADLGSEARALLGALLGSGRHCPPPPCGNLGESGDRARWRQRSLPTTLLRLAF